MKPTVGFIGLGLMGAPMAMRLVDAGYPLHVFNRTKEKCAPLVHKGAYAASAPAEVAEKSDIVITMVTNDDALRSVSSQIQSIARSGSIHIDCSTVSPVLTTALEKEYSQTGRFFLHSPVLGSIPQATDGTLMLFVGGSDDAYATADPVLTMLGQKIWRFPKVEHASIMKLIMNSFITGMIGTLSQALAFAQNAGVGGETVLDVLNSSALNSAMYQTKGKSILEKNFSPRFFLENLLKDTNLFREAARSYSVDTPVTESMKSVLEKAVSQGLGKEDYSAIIKILQ
ncbi:MAG: NAD(P)-dependent oxidoreductase [Ignavibacteriales bacterium]|nr:NAD(P)-dependent oxidoreductase [Ignavibacteriales bacterium]